MREPPADHAANGKPADGTGSADLDEIRRLLLGQDLDRLADISDRLADPARRVVDVAQVLPDAIRTTRARNLREALEPVFEKSFQSSVRKHPRELADAIYPVIGPAIRAAIAAAIRESAEALNQIIEKSASWRAIRWRIEARMTGRPFTEILLARSLLYSVEQVFLIHRGSGLLLVHATAKSAVVKDADMISGMLTAIQDFVSDSFAEGGQELETIDAGRFKLWIQYGPKALLAGAVTGTAPVELKGVFRTAIERIHETLFAELDTFKQGDLAVFEPARPFLEGCLLGQAAPTRRIGVVRWMLAAAVVALGALVFLQVRTHVRWSRYLEHLQRQPGIVVTRAERHGSTWTVAGLKDPKAPDPAQRLGGFHLDPAQVRYEWQPYLSLNTPFAEEREVDAAREHIEKQIVRFEVGSALLPLAETGRVETLALAIGRLLKARPESRITVSGHTDEVGSLDANARLSRDRAASVGEALAAQGVPLERLELVGAGNTQPVRAGSGEWNRSANRSASFRVNVAPAPGR